MPYARAPTSIPTMANRSGQLPVPIAAIEVAGQIPEMPQPRPKMIAPTIVRFVIGKSS